jgi:membrane protease YdiL (CAAX protease family)
MKLYIFLTYLIAWVWWIPLAIAKKTVYPGVGWPTHLIGLMAPAIAAFIVVYRESGRIGLSDLWARIVRNTFNKVTAFLTLGTLVFAFIPVLFDNSISLSDLGKYSGAPDKGLLAILLVLLINGYGEEIGWRGYLAEKFLKDESISKSAFKIWLVWAPWHLPLFFVLDTYKEMNFFMLIGWVVSIYFGSVVLTWFYKYSKSSLLVVVCWHIAYNLSVATAASKGIATALVSSLVIVGAIWILRTEIKNPASIR